MKKSLLFLLVAVLMLISGLSRAQLSLSLSDSTGPIANQGLKICTGVPSADIVSYIFVKNVSANPLYIRVKKVEVDVLSGSLNTFCWGLCYAPVVFLSPDSIQIMPGKTDSIDFSGHYTPNNFKGVTTMQYVFFNCANPNDSVSAVVKYSAFPSGIETLSSAASVSNAYPSPAGSIVNFDYSGVTAPGSTVVIRNMLGSVVKETGISLGSGKVTIPVSDLNEGLYFYSLISNDKPVVTKRFIVQR